MGHRKDNLPSWDEPATGMDVESLASAFMQRWFKGKHDDAILSDITRMMYDALHYGSVQIRDRFLSPRLRTILFGGQGAGQFWECRFCRSTVPVESSPNEMPHHPGCHLLTKGITLEVVSGHPEYLSPARIR